MAKVKTRMKRIFEAMSQMFRNINCPASSAEGRLIGAIQGLCENDSNLDLATFMHNAQYKDDENISRKDAQ